MAAVVLCRNDVSVVALCDAVGNAPDPLEAVFPALGRTGTWRLHVHCFLVRARGRLVLVDTGLGPEWAPGARWLSTPGRLPDELAAVGVGPADVTDVILTHLHLDHVGWNVSAGGDGEPVPLFANARHVVQERELARLRAGAPAHQELYRTHLRPLDEHGLLVGVDGAHTLLPGVELLPTPGHTPGHQSVLVDGDRQPVLLTGDVFVHDEQVRDPALAYGYEADPVEAARTRVRMLELAVSRACVVGPAHSDAPFLRAVAPAGQPVAVAEQLADPNPGAVGVLRPLGPCDRA